MATSVEDQIKAGNAAVDRIINEGRAAKVAVPPPAKKPVPEGQVSQEEAAEFIRQMQGGRATKEQEHREFTRQVPEKKFAKGGGVRGGGIESRGKTKGRIR